MSYKMGTVDYSLTITCCVFKKNCIFATEFFIPNGWESHHFCGFNVALSSFLQAENLRNFQSLQNVSGGCVESYDYPKEEERHGSLTR